MRIPAWISASDNYKRIKVDGLTDQVFPIHSDARELPFAEEFFDAIVCVDAYIYFGTDDLYLDYLNRRSWRAVKTSPPTRLTKANPINVSNTGIQSTGHDRKSTMSRTGSTA